MLAILTGDQALLTIQFFERSHVPGLLPTSQISHVNLFDSQNGGLSLTGFVLNYLTHLFTTNHSHISKIGLVSSLPLGNTLELVGGGGRAYSNTHAPGGHFNFICTGVCGHRIGKLTHPQTKAGKKQTYSQTIYNRNVLFNLEESHPFPGKIISKL